jgi:2-C-methyl-D-erythritol 2,4-cyclodiphosphate synthase
MFPDNDAQYRDADSLALLAQAARRVRELGYQVANLDSTIIAEAPRLAPYLPLMAGRIAGALGVEPSQVNVKAKTAEKLGPVGQGAAIQAQAVVLLTRD